MVMFWMEGMLLKGSVGRLGNSGVRVPRREFPGLELMAVGWESGECADQGLWAAVYVARRSASACAAAFFEGGSVDVGLDDAFIVFFSAAAFVVSASSSNSSSYQLPFWWLPFCRHASASCSFSSWAVFCSAAPLSVQLLHMICFT